MKRGWFSLCFTFFTATLVLAQSTAKLSADAQRAFLAGDMETAKIKFRTVLQVDPANVTARNYLRMIVVQENQGGAGTIESQLKNIKLPMVQFQDATFGAALEFVKQQAAKQSATISFVTKVPPEMLLKKVTLNLTNVPLGEALRYLCDLVGATAVAEKYAIVIKPSATPRRR